MTTLQPEEWDALSQVEELLPKFAMYANVAGGEQYTTLSLVIPYYLDLQLHLGYMKEVDAMAQIADVMLTELDKCFGKLLDWKQKGHNPMYMIATFLDPRYKMLIRLIMPRESVLSC